jgi:DNA-binding IclR family transcriptional regulator
VLFAGARSPAYAHLSRLAQEQHADVRLCVLIGGQVLTLIPVPPKKAAGAEALTQTPCGPVLAMDWPDAALSELIPDCAVPDHDNLLAGCAQARAQGYVHYPEDDAEPARYTAPIRDFKGIALAAIQLAPRPGEESADDATPPGDAVLAAANARSADLGFEG